MLLANNVRIIIENPTFDFSAIYQVKSGLKYSRTLHKAVLSSLNLEKTWCNACMSRHRFCCTLMCHGKMFTISAQRECMLIFREPTTRRNWNLNIWKIHPNDDIASGQSILAVSSALESYAILHVAKGAWLFSQRQNWTRRHAQKRFCLTHGFQRHFRLSFPRLPKLEVAQAKSNSWRVIVNWNNCWKGASYRVRGSPIRDIFLGRGD